MSQRGNNAQLQKKKKNAQLQLYLVVKVKSNAVKNSIALEPQIHRSMNQGKLEVVNQETARVNINILGISELKQTGMGKFNSDDHYIYYCGQVSLRRYGVALILNMRVQNAILGCSLKNDRKISVHFQSQPVNITVIQVYAPTPNIKEAEVERFYEHQ